MLATYFGALGDNLATALALPAARLRPEDTEVGGREAGPDRHGRSRPQRPTGSLPPLSLDRLFLRGIEAHGRHGVHDFERTNGQRFVVDVDYWIDTSAAIRTDYLASTVCYAALYDAVAAIIAGEPCWLIETLADRIVCGLLDGFSAIQAIDLTVHKPDAPIQGRFGDVGPSMFRTRG